MKLNFTPPAWLAALIAWAAGFLAGAASQKATDDQAAHEADATADNTVEDASRQVGALTDDEVNQELTQWQSKP